MSLAKAARKVKRAGKTAVQFRISSTFEFIELECKGTWRPEKLSVIWQRNHRKVKSNETTWVVSDDFGPNGAKGRAVFNPAIAVSLVVTLYRDANLTEFDEKEYKYQIQNDGPGGKKILATFSCNVADFVGIPTTKHALDLNFKCVSKKIKVAKLGITLESQFMKEGGAMDDDMQSTFSALSMGHESVTYDEEDEDEDEVDGGEEDAQFPLASASTNSPGLRNRLNTLQEEEESEDSVHILGTGERIQLATLPRDAPAKPPRPRSFHSQSPSPYGSMKDLTASTPDVNPEPSNKQDDSKGTGAGREGMSEEVEGSRVPPSSNTAQQTLPPAQPPPEIVVSKFDKSLEILASGGTVEEPVPTTPSAPTSNGGSTGRESARVVKEQVPTKEDIPSAPASNGGSTGHESSGVVDNSTTHPEISVAEEEEMRTTGVGGVGLVNGFHEEAELVNGLKEEEVKTTERVEQDSIDVHSVKKTANVDKTADVAGIDKTADVDGTDAYGREINGRGHDYVFEAARSLATVVTKESSASNPGRKTLESIETYTPPPNPYLEEPNEAAEETAPTKPSHTEVWLERDAVLVDCFNEVVSREKLEQADLIGLYFSAGWCPPCRRFLPKLVKFYHHLKQHGKAFEILYISSDYSKQDMVKYMKEQQMPWMGISYEGSVSEDFRKKFNVSAVPLFKILGRRGDLIEDTAKRLVEGASSGAAILKLYNKWHEKMMLGESTGDTGRVPTNSSKEKKGILSLVKSKSKDKSKESEQQSEVSSPPPHETSPPRSPESGRRVLDTRTTRSKGKGSKGAVSAELLEEKEEKIQHLEEVNRTLKQTNDELSEDLEELRQKFEAVSAELEKIKSTSKTLQEQSKELIANLNMRGWLYKRGVRGPTASIWRRRYFRLDQGSKLYYYKNSSEGNPQGFIDVDKVIDVRQVADSQQDKNHATFNVQCDGRTFQLQAHDEPSMRKWMEAILYMTSWRKKNSTVSVEDL